MNKIQLNKLKKIAKKSGTYKPDDAPHKPEKQPSVAELNEVYFLDGKKLVVGVK